MDNYEMSIVCGSTEMFGREQSVCTYPGGPPGPAGGMPCCGGCALSAQNRVNWEMDIN